MGVRREGPEKAYPRDLRRLLRFRRERRSKDAEDERDEEYRPWPIPHSAIRNPKLLHWITSSARTRTD
jgi:hypothetical protein